MPGALEYHRRAQPIHEKLLVARPNNPANRRSLSRVYEDIGRALFLSNDTTGALENNSKALALREKLLAEDPNNTDYRRILGISYQNNGDYQAWIKNTPGALESFRKKAAIDEESLAADPANAQARADLAYSCLRIGDLLVELGNHSQAVPHYRRSLEMYENNMAAYLQDLTTRMRVICGHARLGKAHAKCGSFVLAREDCAKATELLQAAVDDPSNVNQRRLTVIAYADLGDAYAAFGADNGAPIGLAHQHRRAARDMYQRSLDIMQELRNSGILNADEVGEIETFGRKIAECEAFLKK